MILFNDYRHGNDIAVAAGASFNPKVDQCIARVDRDGELMGGVVYQNFTGHSIGIHVAGFRDDWINKDMLWVCFHYPFVQLGCVKMFGQVPASNRQALEFDLKLGFKEVARIADVYADCDLVVIAMSRDECRWLRLRPSGLSPR